MKGKPTIKQLRDKLDKLFPAWIKNRDADWKGQASCCTCGRQFPIEEMDAGHYISRKHPSTRWHEKNTHAQCRFCNRFRHGKPDEYALFLIRKYGEGILEELNKIKHEDKKWKYQELVDMVEYYKNKLEKL